MPKIDLVSLKEKFVDVEGIKMQYFTGGAGQPVLVIHGWPLSIHLPHWILEELARSFRVFAVNLPGFVGTEAPNFIPTIDNYARHLREFTGKLEIGKHSVIGWSYGGMVAIKYAASNQENVSRLVLCSTAATEKYIACRFLKLIYQSMSLAYDKVPGIDCLIEKLLDNNSVVAYIWEKFSHDKNKDSSIADLKKLSVSFSKVIIDSILKVNLEKECRTLNEIPTLILCGEKDNFTSIKAGNELNKFINNSYLSIVSNSGHSDTLNKPSIGAVVAFIKC